MFAYCGNNPTCRLDMSGEIWVVIVATANDINQLLREDDKKITLTMTSKNESIQISNSTNIVTPWVQLGYSVYLNHFSEYKDYFTGSSVGMMFEWTVHNVGYYAFSVGTAVGNFANIETKRMDLWKNSCSDVDLGPTIYHDTGSGARGLMSKAMKIGYGIMNPVFALLDKVAYSRY